VIIAWTTVEVLQLIRLLLLVLPDDSRLWSTPGRLEPVTLLLVVDVGNMLGFGGGKGALQVIVLRLLGDLGANTWGAELP
jgi:hypothetical protein